jgi:hypothetical protein
VPRRSGDPATGDAAKTVGRSFHLHPDQELAVETSNGHHPRDRREIPWCEKIYASCSFANWSFREPFDSSRMQMPESAAVDPSQP